MKQIKKVKKASVKRSLKTKKKTKKSCGCKH